MKKIIIPVLLMVTAAVSIHCEADSPLTLNASANDSTYIIADSVATDIIVVDTIITDTVWYPHDSVITPVDSVRTDTTWIPETPVDSTGSTVDSTARKHYKRIK